jgi:LysR family hydrogen peroxide-inducible transcriptional activator
MRRIARRARGTLPRMRPTLRQLEYAVAIADHGSFHRAARACHVTQPGLSAQVAQLESLLELRLFERGSRRVLVTPAGEALVRRARALLRDADELVDAARAYPRPLSGTLRLGAIRR